MKEILLVASLSSHKKAFDKTEHDILLTKLENYGVRGLAKDSSKSCLSDRKQFFQ